MKIRDRIKELRRVKASELHPHPMNWRTHSQEQLDAIRGVLAEVGFAGAELARELPDGSLQLIDGHARAEVAGDAEVPVLVLDVTEDEAKKILATFDPIGAMATADAVKLDAILREVETGSEALADMLTALAEDNGILDGLNDHGETEVVEDEVPEPPAEPITKPGDLWILGRHRVLCGDSTKAQDVARLMDGKRAQLIHADPPYGMSKEADGVANDNLYFEKLAEFQMQWWRAFLPHCAPNASGYIWGWEDSLFDFYLRLRADDSQRITKRNYIIWNKKSGQGISQESLRRFAPVTEHALFFMLGEQGFNNNADNYWEGWEPIRSYLEGEMKKAGWTVKDLNRITGTQMGGHWVTRSQWAMITAEHYATIQQAAREHDAFKREHDAFKREHDQLKREHDQLKRDFYATRAYFDNTHDNMTDVWEFPRVTGEERHGHATPKPVAMMVRAIKSSCPEGGIVAEPFGGSGSTLIGAETCGRTCYTMELSEAYVDVIVKRWETLTGEKAVCQSATHGS